MCIYFIFQAEDGIRDGHVTGVQTCALPILLNLVIFNFILLLDLNQHVVSLGGRCMSYIEVKNSYKRYQMGDTEIVANNNVSFEVNEGELAIILGASGAGKTTMLNVLDGMDLVDVGLIIINVHDI